MPYSLGVAIPAYFGHRSEPTVTLKGCDTLGFDGILGFLRHGCPLCLVSCLCFVAPCFTLPRGPWALLRGHESGRGGPHSPSVGQLLTVFSSKRAALMTSADLLARLLRDRVSNGDVCLAAKVQAVIAHRFPAGIKIVLLTLSEQLRSRALHDLKHGESKGIFAIFRPSVLQRRIVVLPLTQPLAMVMPSASHVDRTADVLLARCSVGDRVDAGRRGHVTHGVPSPHPSILSGGRANGRTT